MRILKTMLPLLLLLLWGGAAKAQYDPASPPEPGVYFTLTTRAVPADAAYSFSGGGNHAFGSNINVRVGINTGYRLVGWEDENGTVVSTSSDFVYVMPAKNVVLTARFVYDPSSPAEPSTPEFKDVSYISFQINPSDAGSISSGSAGEYEVGSTQRFTARANSNYRFANWTCEGIELGTSSTLEYTIPKGDRVLVANFTYDPSNPSEPSVPNIPRNLTLMTNMEGAGSLTGGGSHDVGSTFTVRCTENTYYHFVNWTDEDGNVVSETSSFTYTMPDRHVTLTANYTYNYDPSSPGDPGTPNPDNTVAENMVLWPRMGMYDDTHVQILCETPGATIHYTLDGTTPNAESPVYTEPVYVGSNLLVRAIAYKEGMEDSPVVSYQVTAYKAGTPVFTFENLKLKITSSTEGATIRFTTDFTDPTEESEVYTEPFTPEDNCRIKAYASKEGLADSPINVFVFRISDYTIPAPTLTMNEEGLLVITPSVSGGTTYYTLDGTDPTTASALYTEPLPLDGNFTVRAYTVHSAYYDSPIGELVIEGYRVADLTYEYKERALTLATTTDGATVRYTTDGTVPTEESAAYTAPLSLTEDCKVVARGFKANYEPSDTISYTFVLSEHKVATPVLTYDPANLTLTMECDTENAEIRYTIDGEAPTATTGTVYEGPVAVVGNHTYTAKAFRSDLFDSEAAIYEVSDLMLPTPTAAYGGHAVTLSCAEEGAEIHYTLDGSTPTSGSALYSAPIPMTADCTVRFIATKTGYNDSEEASYTFTLADWQETAPAVVKDFRNRRIYMQSSSEAGIRVLIDGTPQILASQDTIDVVPSMSRIEVISIATDEDRYDSDTLTEEIIFHLPPVLWHDGFEGHVIIASDDPAPDGAERHLDFGPDRYIDVGDITFPITGFETMVAHVESDHAFCSDVAWEEIYYYNTGEEAGATSGYSISEAFQAWNDRMEDFKYLRITGDLNRSDLQFVAALPQLTTLDIICSPNADCDSVFAGSRIETLATYFLKPGMLKGMQRLTNLFWYGTVTVPNDQLSEAGNPNLMLWVYDAALAPDEATNIVTYPFVEGNAPTDPYGPGVRGTAESISLQAGHPFGVHMPVDASEISLVKEFTLPTEIGQCAGWETLTVPFDVEAIRHEESGDIVPFALWSGPEHPARPFWLYGASSATATGWQEATGIEAGTPYIISMPNNEEYIEGYSLPGRVTFSASGVTLTPEGTQPKETDWIDGISFAGTFMPVEETGIRSLNVSNAAGRDWLGSAFVEEDTTLPFGAYMRGEGMPKQIPVFGDWSGVMTPGADPAGITVETPAPGQIRVSSTRDCRIAVVSTDGAVVRQLDVKAGESATADGLARGLYIAAGVKVIVR